MYVAGLSFVLLSLVVTTGLAEVPEFSSTRHLVKRRFCTKGKPQPRSAVKTGKRLASLRALMLKVVGGLQAYIVPSVDAHQSEYVAPEHKRRQYISGFSGSYGTAIITLQKAALWVDGRYFIQADMELDCNWILQREGIKGTPTQTQWLIQNLRKGSRVGVDPFLISICEWDRMSKELRKSGIKLLEVTRNLVDHIWENRPKPQGAQLMVLGTNYTGKAWENKTAELRKTLKAKSAAAVILHKLDEIAWLFNLRGFDIPYTPVFFSYATITDKTIKLFVDSCKITTVVKTHLNVGKRVDANNPCVLIKPYETIHDEVKRLAAQKDAKILVSPSSSQGIRMDIAKNELLMDESPVALPKALKNPTEVAGMKNANLKDCVALCEFFAWIEKEIPNNSSHLTEMAAERQLLEYRKLQKDFISPSFDTIAGFGPNSAIIHYKANSFTNAVISNESVFLLDSGGQYLDGTTDTTRTVHFGKPTEYQRDCYTRVLKGHIDIANAVFPNDTYGRTLDVFAREPLWKVGLDYRHGTGHGIGHFLNVHEGPQCISPGFPVEDEKILMSGMILSDEPAYYEDEEFGIRLETAVLVKKAPTKYHFDGLDYLKFEPVTFIPFQKKLINVSMLTKSQVDWLNRYHKKTRHIVGDELERQGKVGAPLEWLIRETEPLSYHTN